MNVIKHCLDPCKIQRQGKSAFGYLSSTFNIAHHRTVSLSTSAKSFIVSLERSVGARQGVDQQLSELGSFDSEVYPDLPVNTDWRSYFGSLVSR